MAAMLVYTCLQDDWSSSNEQLQIARDAARASMDHIGPEEWVDRFGNEPRKGADILVQCLEREGAYRCSLLSNSCSSSAPTWPLRLAALPELRLLEGSAARGAPQVQVGMGLRKTEVQCLSPRSGMPLW